MSTLNRYAVLLYCVSSKCKTLHVARHPSLPVWWLLFFNYSSCFASPPLAHYETKMRKRKYKKGNNLKKRVCPFLFIGSLCLCWSVGVLSHLCLSRQMLRQLALLGFPTSSLPLKILFISFAASAFSPSFPQQVLYCLPSSFHTLIAWISHRTPLANCIILMVFFMIVHCGKLTFLAAN